MFSPPPFQLENLPLVVARFLRSGQQKRRAAVVVGQCEPGIEPDGLVVVGDGLVVVLLGKPCVAAVVVGECVPRIEPDGLVVVGDGDLELFPLPPDIGSPEVVGRGARVGADLVGDVVDRLVEKDDVGGRRPAFYPGTLGHEPQPRAVRLLDLVDPEDVLLLTPGEVLAAPLVVNDLVADLEHGAVLGDHPLADPAVSAACWARECRAGASIWSSLSSVTTSSSHCSRAE